MKLTIILLFMVQLLCSPANGRDRPGPPPNAKACSRRNSKGEYENFQVCQPGELCGILRTGIPDGCVSAGNCPTEVDEKDYDYKIYCSPHAPHCCCKSTQPNGQGGFLECNDILDTETDTIWKQACSLPELKSTFSCRYNPTIQIECISKSSEGEDYKTEICNKITHPFCGINKATGDFGGCVKAYDCPEPEKVNGLPIVCESSTVAPYCCCQGYDGVRPQLCNDYLRNADIWKQACGLPELKPLEQCKKPPIMSNSTTSATTNQPQPPTASQKGMKTESNDNCVNKTSLLLLMAMAVIATATFVAFLE